MKLHTLAFVTTFSVLGLRAEAQTCGVLCDAIFWKTASKTEVAEEISKADLSARSADGGFTPLMVAAAVGTPENIKVLLDAGADLSARSAGDGFTPLMVAAASGTPENVKVLLDAGADLNARTLLDGTTLLAVAAGWGTPENIKVLLDAGADLNARNTASGTTPLMVAAVYGTPENVKVLLDAGAEVSAKSTDGLTAWDYAQDNDKLKETDVYLMLRPPSEVSILKLALAMCEQDDFMPDYACGCYAQHLEQGLTDAEKLHIKRIFTGDAVAAFGLAFDYGKLNSLSAKLQMPMSCL